MANNYGNTSIQKVTLNGIPIVTVKSNEIKENLLSMYSVTIDGDIDDDITFREVSLSIKGRLRRHKFHPNVFNFDNELLFTANNEAPNEVTVESKRFGVKVTCKFKRKITIDAVSKKEYINRALLSNILNLANKERNKNNGYVPLYSKKKQSANKYYRISPDNVKRDIYQNGPKWPCIDFRIYHGHQQNIKICINNDIYISTNIVRIFFAKHTLDELILANNNDNNFIGKIAFIKHLNKMTTIDNIDGKRWQDTFIYVCVLYVCFAIFILYI